jgi:hypothetical protein
MDRDRVRLLLALLLAGLLGFGAGWWLRARSDTPLEVRARNALLHVREAFHELTR